MYQSSSVLAREERPYVQTKGKVTYQCTARLYGLKNKTKKNAISCFLQNREQLFFSALLTCWAQHLMVTADTVLEYCPCIFGNLSSESAARFKKRWWLNGLTLFQILSLSIKWNSSTSLLKLSWRVLYRCCLVSPFWIQCIVLCPDPETYVVILVRMELIGWEHLGHLKRGISQLKTSVTQRGLPGQHKTLKISGPICHENTPQANYQTSS